MEQQEIALSPLFQQHVRLASHYIDHLSGSSDRAAAFHAEAVDRFTTSLEGEHLESVAEAVFLVWWRAITSWYSRVPLAIETQRTVTVGGRGYRLDFVIGMTGDNPAYRTLAVEIDGHAFHERTREQVTYRNQRDRDLQRAGWKVLHYSFEELTSDPHRVVDEVFTEASEVWAYHGSPAAPSVEEPVL